MVGCHFCDYITHDYNACLARGLSFATCDEASGYIREAHRPELREASIDNQQRPKNDQQEPKSLNLAGCKGLNSAKNLKSLNMDLSLVEPSYETSVPTNTQLQFCKTLKELAKGKG